MSSSELKLNPDKTESLLIGSKMQREKNLKCFPIRLLVREVTPSPTSLIGSKLDYCNSVLFNVTEKEISELFGS